MQIDKLLLAWKILCESHEILRTRIVQDGVRYLQVVHRAQFSATRHSEDVAAYLESDQRRLFVAGATPYIVVIIIQIESS